MKNNKSAKDIAFDKERAKYHKEIRELKYELQKAIVERNEYVEKLAAAEDKCEQLQDWINRLLEYTEMSEEDMKRIIQKDKETSEAMEHLNSMFDIFGRFGGSYF